MYYRVITHIADQVDASSSGRCYWFNNAWALVLGKIIWDWGRKKEIQIGKMTNDCKHIIITRGLLWQTGTGVLLQNSWYSEGSTKVWGTIWKFLKPWVCCIRWMFLYRRSLRVSSYDLEMSRASGFKTLQRSTVQLCHWQNKNKCIHNSNGSTSDSMIHFLFERGTGPT